MLDLIDSDGSLDFVYIDGDHTLKGTNTDLAAWWPKLRPGGWLCGDDYTDHQHVSFVF